MNFHSDFSQELAEGFREAAVGVGMGITIRHKGRLITAIEESQTAGLEFMDGGALEQGSRTFICAKADFGTLQPEPEQRLEVVPGAGVGGPAGGVIKLRISSVETKQIEPTIRLVCQPEDK